MMTEDQDRSLTKSDLELQKIVRSVSAVSSTCPDMRFLFGKKGTVYSHTAIIRSASAHFKSTFESGFSESAKRAMTSDDSTDCADTILDETEDSDYEDEKQSASSMGKNPLDDVPMKTAKITDFS